MKFSMKRLALFMVLGLTAVSCQKTEDFNPLTSSEQTPETFQVMYSINGEVYQTTLSESEWDAFVERMLALAREGYEVTFSKNSSSLTSQSKEIVTYVTKSEHDAHVWSEDMANNGYEVTITYNKETGEYTCVATR